MERGFSKGSSFCRIPQANVPSFQESFPMRFALCVFYTIGLTLLTTPGEVLSYFYGYSEVILMPTYEYRAKLDRSCAPCRSGFEIIQRMIDPPLTHCPKCKNPVYRVLFAPAVVVRG